MGSSRNDACMMIIALDVGHWGVLLLLLLYFGRLLKSVLPVLAEHRECLSWASLSICENSQIESLYDFHDFWFNVGKYFSLVLLAWKRAIKLSLYLIILIYFDCHRSFLGIYILTSWPIVTTFSVPDSMLIKGLARTITLTEESSLLLLGLLFFITYSKLSLYILMLYFYSFHKRITHANIITEIDLIEVIYVFIENKKAI